MNTNPEDRAFADRYGPWALVTGGSEGVGAAWAAAIASRGLNLLLLARRADVLSAKARELEDTFGIHVEGISIDVTANEFPAALDDLARSHEVGLVIHNVGSVSRNHGWFLDDPRETTSDTITVNCVVPAMLAHSFLPAMRDRGQGGFVLIGSLAGLAGQPLEATYSASKAFSRVFAEALWNEHHDDGIDVISIPLGGTRTEALTANGLLDGIDLPTAEDVVAEAN